MQGLNELNEKAAELMESNALALAIAPSGRSYNVRHNINILLSFNMNEYFLYQSCQLTLGYSLDCMCFMVLNFYSCLVGNDPTTYHGLNDISGAGWELALVTTPSNSSSHVVESKLVSLL